MGPLSRQSQTPPCPPAMVLPTWSFLRFLRPHRPRCLTTTAMVTRNYLLNKLPGCGMVCLRICKWFSQAPNKPSWQGLILGFAVLWPSVSPSTETSLVSFLLTEAPNATGQQTLRQGLAMRACWEPEENIYRSRKGEEIQGHCPSPMACLHQKALRK